MTPSKQARHTAAQEWLRQADEDLEVAKCLLLSPRPHFGAVGFHAQQAAERYVKALLICLQIEFPWTHDLDRLLDLIAMADGPLANVLRDTAVLSAYGVEAQEPADIPVLTVRQAQEAVALASKVKAATGAALR